MRYDAEHKLKTRVTLLKAAAKAIRKDGPHNLSLSGVMAAAGLTNGGFYAHFKSRDELLAAGIEQMFRESRAGQLLDSASGRGGLEAYLSFYLSKAHRDTRSYGCPLPGLSSEASRLPSASGELFAKGVARLSAMLAAKLRECGVADADEEAGALLAQLVGTLTIARAESDPAASDLILARTRNSVARRFGLVVPVTPPPHPSSTN